MTRRPSSVVAARNATVLDRLLALKAEHPFWGYRRLWAHLKYVEGLPVNRKRILRLARLAGLLVQGRALRAKRIPQTRKPRPTAPHQWWGIDMTKVMVESVGWVYLVIVLDWYTKKAVGHYVGQRATARHWLDALDHAVQRQFPAGVQGCGLSLMSDNGSQPTSVVFMKTCSTLGIHQAFTSYNNPKGNADTERFMRTMKEELLWLHDWRSPAELATAVTAWLEHYNQQYLHSALGYRPPQQVEQAWMEHTTGHITHYAAA